MNPSTDHPQQFPLSRTKDLQESTVLVVSGKSLRGVESGDQNAIFVFIDDGDIQQILLKFYSGELRLNPKDLFSVWRGLRSMTYTAMGSMRGSR
jgi:hypothetical protein